jgi:hypothetical protein
VSRRLPNVWILSSVLLAGCSGGGAPPAPTAPGPAASASSQAAPDPAAAPPGSGAASQVRAAGVDVAALLADPSLAVDIPSPDEMFTAMQRAESKAGRSVTWTSLVAARPAELPKEPARLALRLGAVMADFFSAVQAKDAGMAGAAADEMKAIGERLGLTAEIGDYHTRAKAAIASGSWDTIRRELQLAHSIVKQKLESLPSPELGYLVGAGLWIRGVEIGSSYLKEAASWSAEGAGMMRQGAVAGAISSALGSMKGDLATDPTVSQVGSGLRQLESKLSFARESPPDAAAVAAIHADVVAIRSSFL